MGGFYDWAEDEVLGDQHRTVHNELGYITRGAGDPEGAVTADIGSIYIRSDGGDGTTVYLKESGSGNTGWVAVTTDAVISDHGALTGLTDDDHTQYRLESADHTHVSTGLQGGQLDHGTALTGLSDDDHPQYATNTEFDDHSARHEDGGADEISIAGLSGTPAELTTHAGAADPHTGYVLESLIDAVGDLIVGSADNAVGRLAKGTTGQHLITDTGETLDLKWESQTITIGAVFTTLTVGDYIVWRVPFACTVTAVRGYVDTGTTTQINAKKVGTGDFCSADITIDPSDAWEAGTVNQNTALSAGDTVAVEIVAAGTATQLTIQVEVTRP